MNILGDSQIPLLHELFSYFGKVRTYSGREVSPEQLTGVEVLLTRSTLQVDQHLLAESSVKFVGTCTIGTDHIDTDYLSQCGISWANAAGCNASSVMQYVLSSMAQLSPGWMQSTVGIIGCGHIGGQIYRRLRSLGVNCRCYDPFLSVDINPDLTSLEHVLAADIITCHTPLTRTGEHPTWHLVDENALMQLRPGSLLINAGRGAVIDNKALLQHLKQDKTIKVALDVWENEPDILTELLPYIDIATPHIAGHSLEGKQKGTAMVYHAFCEFLGITPPIDSRQVLDTSTASLRLEPADLDEATLLNQWLLAAYPIMQDDARLRQWQPSVNSMAAHFDDLRKHYPVRREYTHFIDAVHQERLNQWLTIVKA